MCYDVGMKTILNSRHRSRTIQRLVICVCFVLAARIVLADDVVFLRSEDGTNRTTRLSGKILDWSGDGIMLERIGGRQQLIPPTRIADVQTPWTAKHVEGDRLFSQNDFQAALDNYRVAAREESRTWGKRKIFASCVNCYANLGQFDRAGEAFLAIVGNDPKTQHYNVIPLAWATPRQNTTLETHAQTWLNSNALPAKLIGASWLLSTRHRAAAITTLEQLTTSSDARVVFLAIAQLWRTRVVTATADDVARWRERIERMPRELRAGPHFIVGQALARLGQQQEAAIAFMRVRILFPQQRQLCAEALTQAARQLQSLGETKQAAELYREVLLKFVDTSSAAVAQARLDSLTSANFKTGEP